MKKRMNKSRLLAMLVTLAMLVGMLAVPAMAADGPDGGFTPPMGFFSDENGKVGTKLGEQLTFTPGEPLTLWFLTDGNENLTDENVAVEIDGTQYPGLGTIVCSEDGDIYIRIDIPAEDLPTKRTALQVKGGMLVDETLDWGFGQSLTLIPEGASDEGSDGPGEGFVPPMGFFSDENGNVGTELGDQLTFTPGEPLTLWFLTDGNENQTDENIAVEIDGTQYPGLGTIVRSEDGNIYIRIDIPAEDLPTKRTALQVKGGMLVDETLDWGFGRSLTLIPEGSSDEGNDGPPDNGGDTVVSGFYSDKDGEIGTELGDQVVFTSGEPLTLWYVRSGDVENMTAENVALEIGGTQYPGLVTLVLREDGACYMVRIDIPAEDLPVNSTTLQLLGGENATGDKTLGWGFNTGLKLVPTVSTQTTPQGVTGTTVTDLEGNVTALSASVPAELATGEAVTLPLTVAAAKTADEAPVITITASQGTKVEIPVTDVKAGVVAVLVKEDGTEEIVKTSGISENGLILTLDGDTQIKVIDNAMTFDDVSGGWYQDAVDFVSSREIMVGDSGTFLPKKNLNRAMMAQLLYNLDSGEVQGTASGFTDVGTSWYTDAVNWAAENKIVDGYGDGTFGPTKDITREQMVVFLYRYAKMKGYDVSQRADLTGFTDSTGISSWAEDAMSWAVAVGLVDGIDDTTLSPKGVANRAQVATVLMRFCSKVG